MQLYALDLKGQLINAHQAVRHIDYQCLECQQIIRLRGGPYRQPHFYHLHPAPFCRQHQKGLIHLQLQSYFVQQLPPGDCSLEFRFPSIHRIADVAWHSQKIVFEIQYSAISAEEVLQRNRDYQQEGWRIVWILHDHRYNQVRLSAAERTLQASPHFFSNMNHLGQGSIYDQFDICDQGIRKERLPPLPLIFNQPTTCFSDTQSWPLILLTKRSMNWKLSFKGDLIHLFLESPCHPYLQQAFDLEKDYYPASASSSWHYWINTLWRQGIILPYRTLFRFLLERSCRF